MALEDDVKQALIQAGKQLRDDLWRAEDLVLLESRAKDLVGLNLKANLTQEPEKKKQYQMAAQYVLHHVQMLALVRLQVCEQKTVDQLSKAFIDIAIPLLAKLLIALF